MGIRGGLIDLVYEGGFIGVVKSIGKLEVVMYFGIWGGLRVDFFGAARLIKNKSFQIF